MNNLFKNWKDLINQWFGRSYFDQINQQDATRLATYFQRIQCQGSDNSLVDKEDLDIGLIGFKEK